MPAQEFKPPEISIGSSWIFAPYGRFNLAVQSFADGQSTTTNVVDMSTSTSRVGFYLKPADADQGISVQFETGLGLRPSKKTSQTFTPDFFGWNKKQLRQVQAIYKNDYGTLRIGQGSMATDSIAELDLGKTAVVAKSNIEEMGGSFQFITATGVLSGVDLGATFDSLDGDRRMRLRYDTPDLAGFSASFAYGKEVLTSGVDDRFYDVALRYGATLGNLKIKAGIGNNYVDISGGGLAYTTAGSLSLLEAVSGLNLTVAYGRDASTAATPHYIWAKGGWNTEILSSGPTKLYVEAYWGDDYLTAGAASRMWGLGVMQRIDRYNLDIFAGYRSFSYTDLTATTYRDADAVQIGAHISF